MASAASDAENFVFAPISCAFALRASKSAPVAPLKAWTFDMEDSNAIPVLTTDETSDFAPPAIVSKAFCPMPVRMPKPRPEEIFPDNVSMLRPALLSVEVKPLSTADKTAFTE